MLHFNSTSTAGVAGRKTRKLEEGVVPADMCVSSPEKKRLVGKKDRKAFHKQIPLTVPATLGTGKQILLLPTLDAPMPTCPA